MRTRRPALLLLAAAMCGAALSASADNTAGAGAPAPRQAGSAAGIKSSAGLRMLDDVSTLETDVTGHMTGRKRLTFSDLKKREVDLKEAVTQANALPASERQVLLDRLSTVEQLIARGVALAKGGERLDERVEAVMRKALGKPKPVDALEVIADELVNAASNPAAAQKVFENMRRELGDDYAAPLEQVKQKFSSEPPISFTPPTDPRTLSGRKKDLALRTPAPLGRSADDAAPPAPGLRASLDKATAAAYESFRLQLPDGVEQEFLRQRQALRDDVLAGARETERALGGDPASYAGDEELVAHLEALESRVEASQGFRGPVKELSELPARLDKAGELQPVLADFMRRVWQYRFFLGKAVQDRHAPAGTTLKAWELCPNDQNPVSATVMSVSRAGVDYYGLRYERADRTSTLRGVSENARHSFEVLRNAAGEQTVRAIDYDGKGKPKAQTLETVDVRGHRTKREKYDVAQKILVRSFYDASGLEIRTEKIDIKDGSAQIRDIGGPLHFSAVIDKTHQDVTFLAGPDGKAPPLQRLVQNVQADGSLDLDFRVLPDGAKQVAVSKHVLKDLDPSGNFMRWEVDFSKVTLPGTDASLRDLAKEILSGVGVSDPGGRLAVELATFLRTEAVPEAGPRSILFNVRPGARPIFELTRLHQDNTRTVLRAQFREGGGFDGKGLETALLVNYPAEVDSQGTPRLGGENSAFVEYEYLSDGTRFYDLEPQSEIKHPHWAKFWANDEKITHFYSYLQSWKGDAWSNDSDLTENPRKQQTVELPGTSSGASFARGITEIPGISQVLKFTGEVGQVISSGIEHLTFEQFDIGGPDLASVNRTATCSRNRLCAGKPPEPEQDMKAFTDWVHKVLKDVTPGGRKILDDKVREKVRPEMLSQKGYSAEGSPMYYEQAMAAPVSEIEEYLALSYFGEGTYGRQIAEKGGVGWGIVGALASAGETGLKMASNPIAWLPFIGQLLGKIMEAITAAVEGSEGLTAAVSVVSKIGSKVGSAVEYGVGVPLMASFVVQGATDLAQALGSLGTPESYSKLGEVAGEIVGIKAYGDLVDWSRGKLYPDLTPKTPLGARAVEPPVVEAAPPPDVASPPPVAPPVVEPPPLSPAGPQLELPFEAPKPPAPPPSFAPPPDAPPAPKAPPAAPPNLFLRAASAAGDAGQLAFNFARDGVAKLGGLKTDADLGDARTGFHSTPNSGPLSGGGAGDAAAGGGARPALASGDAVRAPDVPTPDPAAKAAARSAAGPDATGTPPVAPPLLADAGPAARAPVVQAADMMPRAPNPLSVEPPPGEGAARARPPAASAEMPDPASAERPAVKDAPETPKPRDVADGAKAADAAKSGAVDDDAADKPAAKTGAGSGPWDFLRGKLSRFRDRLAGDDDAPPRVRDSDQARGPDEDARARARDGDDAKSRNDSKYDDEEDVKNDKDKVKNNDDQAKKDEKAKNDEDKGKDDEKDAKSKKKPLLKRVKGRGLMYALGAQNAYSVKPVVPGRQPLPPYNPGDGGTPPSKGSNGRGGRHPGAGDDTDGPDQNPEQPTDDGRDQDGSRDSSQPTSPDSDKAKPDSESVVLGGGGAPGGGAGGGAHPDPEGHPKVPKPKGFGDKGGAGGAGKGAPGAGGGAKAAEALPGVSVPGDISAEAPSDAAPAPFAPPIVAPRKSAATTNTGGGLGGHSPEPSLASRFDGSRDRPLIASSWSPTPMKGVSGSGDSAGLPRLGGGRAAPSKPPASGDPGLKDAGASARVGALAGAPGAPALTAAPAPQEEDYNYTYLSPARHKYEMPIDRPESEQKWRYAAWLAARISLSLAAAYLLMHSDFGYLLGWTRRRRDD